MGDTTRIVEKAICTKCGIVFGKMGECPRCGKSDAVSVYFEFDAAKDIFSEDKILHDGVRDPEQA